MATEISLQDLIEKIKTDLFSSYQSAQIKSKSIYPIFFIDQAELELKVDLSYDAGAGIKISIPQIAEGSITGGQGKVSGHTIKITLKPILTTEEQRTLLQADPRLWAGVVDASMAVLRKGTQLAGEEE